MQIRSAMTAGQRHSVAYLEGGGGEKNFTTETKSPNKFRTKMFDSFFSRYSFFPSSRMPGVAGGGGGTPPKYATYTITCEIQERLADFKPLQSVTKG
jgi:hypothetical protein